MSDVLDASTTQGAKPTIRLIEETDSYTNSVAGAVVEAIRIGRGVGPNRVVGIPDDQLTVTRSKIGFPMHTYSEIPEGRVVVVHIGEVAGESRWCGRTLRPDSVILYGPGASHVAVNRPGLSFTFMSTGLDRLQALSELLGQPFQTPHGTVKEFASSTATADVGGSLSAYVSAALDGGSPEAYRQAILRSVVSLLSPSTGGQELGVTRGIDSRLIVQDCIDYAEAIERIPTVSALCLAAHVSQRRLRAAFTQEFDEPPSRFFRNWALERARRQLNRAVPTERTVTDVANELGFDHLGRFSGYYGRLFGETPSATLKALPTSS